MCAHSPQRHRHLRLFRRDAPPREGVDFTGVACGVASGVFFLEASWRSGDASAPLPGYSVVLSGLMLLALY